MVHTVYDDGSTCAARRSAGNITAAGKPAVYYNFIANSASNTRLPLEHLSVFNKKTNIKKALSYFCQCGRERRIKRFERRSVGVHLGGLPCEFVLNLCVWLKCSWLALSANPVDLANLFETRANTPDRNSA